MASRQALLRDVAATIAGLRQSSPSSADCLLVAVDGVDAAGKSIFADSLADALRDLGHAAIRISLDDFHNPRTVRYQRGRDSPEGFWLDSYAYDRFAGDVLIPLGPCGSRRYRDKAHDLASDADVEPEPKYAPAGSIVVIDGLFLHRDELRHHWHYSILLDVPFDVSTRRMADRDGTPPDPDDPRMRRYIEGQRLYLHHCEPHRRASLVVDNTNPSMPRLIG